MNFKLVYSSYLPNMRPMFFSPHEKNVELLNIRSTTSSKFLKVLNLKKSPAWYLRKLKHLNYNSVREIYIKGNPAYELVVLAKKSDGFKLGDYVRIRSNRYPGKFSDRVITFIIYSLEDQCALELA